MKEPPPSTAVTDDDFPWIRPIYDDAQLQRIGKSLAAIGVDLDARLREVLQTLARNFEQFRDCQRMTPKQRGAELTADLKQFEAAYAAIPDRWWQVMAGAAEAGLDVKALDYASRTAREALAKVNCLPTSVP